MAAAELFVALGPHIWLITPVLGLAMLLGVPVLVMVRRIDWRTESLGIAVGYALGLVIFAIMLGGLTVSVVLPDFGIHRPLAPPVLFTLSILLNSTMLMWRRYLPLISDGVRSEWATAILTARFDPAVTLAVTGLVLAVTGSIRLNNDLGPGVAILGHVTIVAALIAAMAGRNEITRDGVVVYFASLALLLGTSLRGWYVTGHDIQREYVEFGITHDAARWIPNTIDPTYNACLSLNIWPQFLSVFTDTSGVWVFKLWMQLVAALVPLLVFLLARRMVSPKLAMMAATIFVVFPSFQTDMPYLNRQSMAFFFQALVLLIATQKSWSLRLRRVFAVIFGLGVVFSHYSTTYLLVLTIGIGAAAALAPQMWRLVRRRRRAALQWPSLALLHPLVVVTLVLGTWMWTSVVTHSGGQFTSVLKYSIVSTFSGGGGLGSSDLSSSIFGGNSATPTERLDSYIGTMLDQRQSSERQFVFDPLPVSLARPAVLDQSMIPLTPAGHWLSSARVDVFEFNVKIRSIAAAFVQLGVLVGFFVVFLRRPRARNYDFEARWLTFGALGALGTVVVVPGISPNYGVLRALQQTLIFGAPVFALGLVAMATPLERIRRLKVSAETVSVVVMSFMALAMTNVIGALLGGYQGQLAMAKDGLYYDQFYVTPAEINALEFAERERAVSNDTNPIVSDAPIVAQFDPSDRQSTDSDLFPAKLPRNALIYLSSTNVVKQRATVFWTGDLLTYRYPVDALEQQLDIIYSGDGVRVYR